MFFLHLSPIYGGQYHWYDHLTKSIHHCTSNSYWIKEGISSICVFLQYTSELTSADIYTHVNAGTPVMATKVANLSVYRY